MPSRKHRRSSRDTKSFWQWVRQLKILKLIQRSLLNLGLDVSVRPRFETLAYYISRYNINVVIDVSANEGQFGSSLRRNGFTGRIISFEPVSHVFDGLMRTAVRDPNWQSYNYALGD